MLDVNEHGLPWQIVGLDRQILENIAHSVVAATFSESVQKHVVDDLGSVFRKEFLVK
jgi:hypothetical protein